MGAAGLCVVWPWAAEGPLPRSFTAPTAVLLQALSAPSEWILPIGLVFLLDWADLVVRWEPTRCWLWSPWHACPASPLDLLGAGCSSYSQPNTVRLRGRRSHQVSAGGGAPDCWEGWKLINVGFVTSL